MLGNVFSLMKQIRNRNGFAALIIPMPTYPPLLLLRAVGFEPGLIILSVAPEMVGRTPSGI